ncbi:MAG: aldolase/citrate lyase family protein [Pseudomonadota bacterium]
MAKKSIRARAMAGESVLGAMVFEFFSPGVAQCLQLAGAEYIIYDMEHTGLGYETLKTQVAHCRGLDVVPMARVPRSDYAFISRALDVGAQGIMVPMVNSVEEARAIAEATRYPPDGRRGAAFGFAHDDYQAGSPIDKIKAANENNLLIAQIETELGLESVEGIAAVEGIDVLWVGHFDLTNFLGIPGQFDHPKYLDALKRVVDAGRKHGKGLGFMASDISWAQEYQDHGFNMLACGTDHGLLMAGAANILDSVRDRKASAGAAKKAKDGKKAKSKK